MTYELNIVHIVQIFYTGILIGSIMYAIHINPHLKKQTSIKHQDKS